MKRSDIIATVLVNCGVSFSQGDAMLLIRKTFEEELPERDFQTWNVELDERSAKSLIDTIGIKTNLNLKMFILDLERF